LDLVFTRTNLYVGRRDGTKLRGGCMGGGWGSHIVILSFSDRLVGFLQIVKLN